MEKMYAERVIFQEANARSQAVNETKPPKALEKEIPRCNNIQMAKKILSTRAYGAIGNQYFRYFQASKCRSYYSFWSDIYPLD